MSSNSFKMRATHKHYLIRCLVPAYKAIAFFSFVFFAMRKLSIRSRRSFEFALRESKSSSKLVGNFFSSSFKRAKQHLLVASVSPSHKVSSAAKIAGSSSSFPWMITSQSNKLLWPSFINFSLSKATPAAHSKTFMFVSRSFERGHGY